MTPKKEMETVCEGVYNRMGFLIRYRNVTRPKKIKEDDTKRQNGNRVV